MNQLLLKLVATITLVFFYSECGSKPPEPNNPQKANSSQGRDDIRGPLTARTLLPGLADSANHITLFNDTEAALAAVDEPNHWLQFNNISLTTNTDLTVTFARTSGNPEYIDQMLLEVHENTLHGPIIGTIDLSDTGSWTSYQSKTIALNNTGNNSTLFFRFTGFGGVNVKEFSLKSHGSKRAKQNAIPASPIKACINLTQLEAPASTAPNYWGVKIEAADLAIIAKAGFDTVRVLVRWSDYAANQAPYTIDPSLFNKLDKIIDWAFAQNLKVVLDIHHYEALNVNAEAERNRFIAMWEQIAEHYKNRDARLIFEILNEPYDENGDGRGMTIARTDEFNRLALEKIREANPKRWVVLATGAFGGMDGLRLSTPPDDPKTILSLHYYTPFAFTHQGAEFTDTPDPLGATWGTPKDKFNLSRDFNLAQSLQYQFGKPLLIGEFGVIQDGNTDGIGEPLIVPETQRAPWTSAVRAESEARGMGWCYFAFDGAFKSYQKDQSRWIPPIKQALLPLK